MTAKMRPYQLECEQEIFAAWHNPACKVVMPVLPTGAGKTVVVGSVARKMGGYGVAIAHRQELVMQISTAYAREEIRHGLITSNKKLIRAITDNHMRECGRSYIDNRADWRVGGVDTIAGIDDPWFNRVGLVTIDEGHHVLKRNKWGKVFAKFPNARGLLPTATAYRADGAGLGSHADGIVDKLILGPTQREIIDMGYLCEFVIRSPKVSDLDITDVPISPVTGELNLDALRKAVHKSRLLIGDMVSHYVEHTPGKLAIAFSVDIEDATKTAEAFRKAGVPSEVISSKTPDDLRQSLIAQFRARKILVLVNVDLFGEGFDLPALEVVIMGRPTESFPLFAQMMGRVARLMISPILAAAWDTYTDAQRRAFIAASEKPYGIVHDHVGNCLRHMVADPAKPRNAPPEIHRDYDLERREKRSAATGNVTPLRVCLTPTCMQPYKRFLAKCPYCGTPAPAPAATDTVDAVDGRLHLLTAEAFRVLGKEKARIDGPAPTISGPGARAAVVKHFERQRAQHELREAMAIWAGAYSQYTDEENYGNFYGQFGIDVISAQCLGTREAGELKQRILRSLVK